MISLQKHRGAQVLTSNLRKQLELGKCIQVQTRSSFYDVRTTTSTLKEATFPASHRVAK